MCFSIVDVALLQTSAQLNVMGCLPILVVLWFRAITLNDFAGVPITNDVSHKSSKNVSGCLKKQALHK